MKVSFTIQLQFAGGGTDSDRLEALLDRVMDELGKLDVVDPAIGGSMTTGEVEISLSVDAASPEDAVPLAMTTIRTAIHAAEGATPGWPRFDKRSLKATVIEPAVGC